MVRSQTPAISAAAIQLILLAIAFKITSCSFIIRSSSAAETFSGVVKLQHPAAFQNRTTHVLIGPDNSHASDRLDGSFDGAQILKYTAMNTTLTRRANGCRIG